MDCAKIISSILIILMLIIIIGSDVYLASCVFNMTGLSWLLFIIIYFFFVFWILRAIVNIGD